MQNKEKSEQLAFNSCYDKLMFSLIGATVEIPSRVYKLTWVYNILSSKIFKNSRS